MSAQDEVSIVRAVYDAFNARDFERAFALAAPGLEQEIVPLDAHFYGPAGLGEYLRIWANAFPDARLEAESAVACGGEVAVEWVFRGTHVGALAGAGMMIPPTGRELEMRGVDLWTVQQGRLVQHRGYPDVLAMVQQLNVLPPGTLQGLDRRAPLHIVAIDLENASPEQNKAVVVRYVEEVLNRGHGGAALALCAPSFAWHGGASGEGGVDEMRQMLAAFRAGFPDLRAAPGEMVAQADLVVVRLGLRGTHLGEFQGVEPTGNPVAFTATNSYRVVDGKVVEEWWQMDLLALMQQIGAVRTMVRSRRLPS